MSGTVIIIPARWGSVRFPGKALVNIAGKPLVQHTWERCLKSKRAKQVILATDDLRIAEVAFDFGAEVALTAETHPTGTDRLAEVAAKLRGCGHVLNVQGDEPGISPKLIDRLIKEMEGDRSIDMITAATAFTNEESARNPNNVKVVMGVNGDALYFSRSLIPFDRDGSGVLRAWHHLGIYGYRRRFLLDYVAWKPTPLERSEKLEQLRALEHGARIRVVKTKHRSVGVDTPEDVALAEAELR